MKGIANGHHHHKHFVWAMQKTGTLLRQRDNGIAGYAGYLKVLKRRRSFLPITREIFADIKDKNRYDIVLANPPFGGKERAGLHFTYGTYETM